MEQIKISRQYKVSKSNASETNLRKKALADEIYNHFQGKINWKLLRFALIDNKGEMFIRDMFEQFKKQEVQSVKYFLGMCRSEKTEWKNLSPVSKQNKINEL